MTCGSKYHMKLFGLWCWRKERRAKGLICLNAESFIDTMMSILMFDERYLKKSPELRNKYLIWYSGDSTKIVFFSLTMWELFDKNASYPLFSTHVSFNYNTPWNLVCSWWILNEHLHYSFSLLMLIVSRARFLFLFMKVY